MFPPRPIGFHQTSRHGSGPRGRRSCRTGGTRRSRPKHGRRPARRRTAPQRRAMGKDDWPCGAMLDSTAPISQHAKRFPSAQTQILTGSTGAAGMSTAGRIPTRLASGRTVGAANRRPRPVKQESKPWVLPHAVLDTLLEVRVDLVDEPSTSTNADWYRARESASANHPVERRPLERRPQLDLVEPYHSHRTPTWPRPGAA